MLMSNNAPPPAPFPPSQPPPPPPPPPHPAPIRSPTGVKRLLDPSFFSGNEEKRPKAAPQHQQPPPPPASGQLHQHQQQQSQQRRLANQLPPPPPPPPPPGSLKRPLPGHQPYNGDDREAKRKFPLLNSRGPPPPPPPVPSSAAANASLEEGELEEGELEDEMEAQAPAPPPPPSSVRSLLQQRPPPPPPPHMLARRSSIPSFVPPPLPPPAPPLSSSMSKSACRPPTSATSPAAAAAAARHRLPGSSSHFPQYLKGDHVTPLPPLLPPPGMYGRSIQAFRDREVIGKGTYGEVSRAVEKDTGEVVALKKVSITLPGEMSQKEGMAITAIRELKALQKLRHKNIVSLKEVATEEGREEVPRDIYLVLEFCEMDLSGVVRTCSLTGKHIRSYMYQILEGLTYIQKQGLLHRDLKTANILVTKGHVVKIADWGLCRWEPMERAKLTNPVVTLWYRAPELLLGTANYGRAVDMWSCGAILVELLTGKPFLEGKDEMDQLHRIFDVCGTPEYDGQYSGPRFVRRTPRLEEELRNRGVRDEKAVALCQQLLSVNPSVRPTADAAADHDFFWSTDEAGNFFEPTTDPSSLPRLVPFRTGVDLDALHEYQVKRR